MSASAAAASLDATSPACAPPMPSATAKSGGASDVGVLVAAPLAARVGRGRVRADVHSSYLRSVSPTLTMSPGASRRGRSTRVAVDEGAVRRAEVVDPDAVAARLDAHVARRGELVAVEGDVVLAAAADRQRRRVELVQLAAAGSTRAAGDDEPRRVRAAAAARPAPRRRGAGRRMKLSCGRRRSRADGAHDPPDEQVEQDEKGDLQGEQRFLERRASDASTPAPSRTRSRSPRRERVARRRASRAGRACR